MPEPQEFDRDLLAAEFALGLLEGDERAQTTRLALSDPEFAASAEAWRARLAPLGQYYADAPAPPLWPAIEARLGATDDRLVRQVRVWRWVSIGTGAVAASLAAALLLIPAPEPVTVVREVVRAPEQVAVAQLGGDAGAALAANYDPAHGSLRIRALTLPKSDLAPELWVIPADGIPRSLGLVEARGVSRVEVPATLRALLIDGATLAVSMEPVEGAPHHAPSSTPIATGKISTL